MTKDFEKSLEEELQRFYEILFREPRFYHDVGDDNSPTHLEEVSLVFRNGKEVRLNCKGREAYDHDAMCRPKYFAEPTAMQIKEIIRREKIEPEVVRYRMRDERPCAPEHLIFEFPFKFIDKILKEGQEGSIKDIPYKIIGDSYE